MFGKHEPNEEFSKMTYKTHHAGIPHKRRLSVELLNRRIKKDGLCFDNLKNFIGNKNSINIAVREDGSKILL